MDAKTLLYVVGDMETPARSIVAGVSTSAHGFADPEDEGQSGEDEEA